jgi:large conductance mechanosensitive channel
MGFISEFKDFAMKGNLIDFAVGVVMGGAFGAVTSSFVDDVFSPPIGLLVGGIDFQGIVLTLKDAVMEGDKVVSPAVSLNVGKFINALIKFIIVAFAMFLVVKGMNSLKKKEEAAPAAPPEPSAQEKLLAEIRDLLKK